MELSIQNKKFNHSLTAYSQSFILSHTCSNLNWKRKKYVFLMIVVFHSLYKTIYLKLDKTRILRHDAVQTLIHLCSILFFVLTGNEK